MSDVQAQTAFIRLSIDTALKSQQRWMKRTRARALLLQTGTVAASGAITVLLGLRGVAPRFETMLANAALVCGIAITVTQAWEAFFSDRDMWISRARCLHEIGSLRSNFEYVIAKHGSDVDPTVLDDFMTQLVRIHEAESRRWREIRGPRWPASQPAAAPSHQPAGKDTV